MATVTQGTTTAEEFFQWVQRPANDGRHFELREGEVIEVDQHLEGASDLPEFRCAAADFFATPGATAD